MEVKKGMVVKSLRGHDEGFFLVLQVDGNILTLANGRQRLLEKPKRKNKKHVCPTGIVFETEGIKTNKKLRELLWPMNFGGGLWQNEEDSHGKR